MKKRKAVAVFIAVFVVLSVNLSIAFSWLFSKFPGGGIYWGGIWLFSLWFFISVGSFYRKEIKEVKRKKPKKRHTSAWIWLVGMMGVIAYLAVFSVLIIDNPVETGIAKGIILSVGIAYEETMKVIYLDKNNIR